MAYRNTPPSMTILSATGAAGGRPRLISKELALTDPALTPEISSVPPRIWMAFDPVRLSEPALTPANWRMPTPVLMSVADPAATEVVMAPPRDWML